MTKYNLPTEMNADSAIKLWTWAVAVSDTVINAPGDRKLRLGDLSPAGVHYVADYGVSQSMTDVHSGMAKKVKDAAALANAADKPDVKPWAKLAVEAGLDPAMPHSVGAVTAGVVDARQQKRFDAIVASSLAVREVTSRLSTRDSWIAKAAVDELAAKHVKANKPMPKGQPLRDLVGRYVATKADYFAKLWAEHEARLAGAAGAADDILGF